MSARRDERLAAADAARTPGRRSHGHGLLLPWSLGFAAGARLLVIRHEIIPESHREGREVFGTAGLMQRLVMMMVLDTAWA